MIEYIKGQVAELTPTYVVIDINGLGYGINITLPCFTALEGKTEAKLLIHEVIREDAWVYYGFLEESERVLFRLLIGVSGVGANTARMILSSLPSLELEQVIMTGDVRRLKGVKGIGAKTAERIIVDLKDKIKPTEATLLIQPAATSADFDEALAAMVMLGFPRQAAHKVLTKLFNADPTLKVEAAIKKALTMM
ncbi:MAG: Holliday junction branch migration protein RuvA [Barnesiella sp.]|nr:Holliday junction branch migration protein RuvA [Bacteroidales bacterium]MBD5235032.1 Holliday junction branch migration protein RuvA [Barnesiella sp.]MBD5247050.1 Holliday junction branch migration protein RuvA [Barnesiella sp.]MBD5257559.1 Holliday junction branch migration protein RuvA [Barnesiella sp.]